MDTLILMKNISEDVKSVHKYFKFKHFISRLEGKNLTNNQNVIKLLVRCFPD